MNDPHTRRTHLPQLLPEMIILHPYILDFVEFALDFQTLIWT